MTLHNDRPKRTRPPMKRVSLWILLGGIAAIFVFVAVTLVVSGQSFF